jgi:GNAT superfamily N-acetyltransferase
MDRKGYGTKIIEELVRWLGEGFIFVNYPKVVYEDLTPDAKEFYLKCGFQSFKEDYKDDEDYGNFYDKAIFLLDEIEQADGDLLYLQAYEGCL